MGFIAGPIFMKIRTPHCEAIAADVDGIETDIRLSADGEPILFHDRLAPNGRAVAALSRIELQETTGHEIPTLDETPRPLSNT